MAYHYIRLLEKAMEKRVLKIILRYCNVYDLWTIAVKGIKPTGTSYHFNISHWFFIMTILFKLQLTHVINYFQLIFLE